MTFGIGWCDRKIHAVFGLKECVRQRNRVDQFHFWIGHKLGIYVEKDWHVNLNTKIKTINKLPKFQILHLLLRVDLIVALQSKNIEFY